MISIVIPTIDGREASYERCREAYENRTEDEFEIITIRNHKVCGTAWQEGAEQAKGAFLHFSADDLEPALGWDIDARNVASEGFLPAPVIFTRNTSQVEKLGFMPDGLFSRIPFCTMDQWQQIGPMIPTHYYTDNWFSWRGSAAGFPTLEVSTYAFRHHWAMSGRYSNEKMAEDGRLYEQYKRDGYGA